MAREVKEPIRPPRAEMRAFTALINSPRSRTDLVEERLRSYGILPVVQLDDINHAEALFAALSEGGLAGAEITLRTPEAGIALEQLIERHPDALLGAGTVRSLDDARRMVDIGASFIVSPGTDEEIIKYCVEHDVLPLPGVCTPTEILRALHAGARLLKFFPAEAAGGAGFLDALSGPFPDVSFVPTGGISEANLDRYLRLPQVAACGGSWMATPMLLSEGSFEKVTELVRSALRIVEVVRGGR